MNVNEFLASLPVLLDTTVKVFEPCDKLADEMLTVHMPVFASAVVVAKAEPFLLIDMVAPGAASPFKSPDFVIESLFKYPVSDCNPMVTADKVGAPELKVDDSFKSATLTFEGNCSDALGVKASVIKTYFEPSLLSKANTFLVVLPPKLPEFIKLPVKVCKTSGLPAL